MEAIEREAMEYDVVVVGGGPAGLAAAIRIKQQAAATGRDVSVCVLEKGAEIGAHTLSGAVIDPRAFDDLMPDWRQRGAPLETPVREDRFLFLTPTGAYRTPSWALPRCFDNHGNFIVSLGNVVRWMGREAEALGVEIFAGFAAAEILYDADGAVAGVATGNQGVGRDGQPTANFQPGVELRGKYTLFAEGSRGHLGRQLVARFNLDQGRDPQAYGLGIKELWDVDPARHEEGLVVHSAGWPLDTHTYGGSFVYHGPKNQVAIGMVVGLGYRNPYLSPFEEFQRLKSHPTMRAFLEGGKRVAYGARAITAGGPQALPKLTFAGGALIGCEAGFLNAARIKGTHGAIVSGLLAGAAAHEAVSAGAAPMNCWPTRGRSNKAGCGRTCARRAISSPGWTRGCTWARSCSASTRCCCAGAHPGRCTGTRPITPSCCRPTVSTHCLPQARWAAELRPAVVRVPVEHESRGEPAGAPDAQGCQRPGGDQSGALCRPGSTLLPGRRLRVRGGRWRRSTPADQRAKLRASQDLRHQGPYAEHRLGGPEGGGGPRYPNM